jgi:hypothetical protein
VFGSTTGLLGTRFGFVNLDAAAIRYRSPGEKPEVAM